MTEPTKEDVAQAERLKSMLKGLVRDSDRYDAEQIKTRGILEIIKDKGHNDLVHTCETIIRRQAEVSSLISEAINGSMPNPDDWDRLSDGVDEMDLLMRRLRRYIGDPR